MILKALIQTVKAFDYQYNYMKKVEQTVNFFRKELNGQQPVFGVTLGSGLGDLADSIEIDKIIKNTDIPNFFVPTTEGHAGNVILGKLEGIPIIGLQGRKHYYEVSHNLMNTGILQVVLPVHVLANLGVKNYFVTNAAGGLNTNYKVGDIMIIDSHINGIPNPLLGEHYEFKRVDNGETVERFTGMEKAYDPEYRELLYTAATRNDLPEEKVHNGVYLALTGTCYETEAECLAFRDGANADAVGMSTTPEVIVARNRLMKCIGMSCITNEIEEDGTNAANHEEVKEVLESLEVRNRLSSTVRNFFGLYRERVYLRQ